MSKTTKNVKTITTIKNAKKVKNVKNTKKGETTMKNTIDPKIIEKLRAELAKVKEEASAQVAKAEEARAAAEAKAALAKSRSAETNPQKLINYMKKHPVCTGIEIDDAIGWTAADRGSALTGAKKLGYRWLKDELKVKGAKSLVQFIYVGKMSDKNWEDYKKSLTNSTHMIKKAEKSA